MKIMVISYKKWITKDSKRAEGTLMRKIVSVLLILLICTSLSSCQMKKKQKEDIHIFFTSDVHCEVSENVGLASLKALVDERKAESSYVALLDCGDYLQGGTLGSLSKGELIVSLMNGMGYDAVTIGNHEFDYGMDVLRDRIAEMEFPVIASNVRYNGNKENALSGTVEYLILEFDQTKVGLIGILTPSSITSSTPKFFMEGDEYVYDFYSDETGDALAEKIQKTVEEVKRQGADYVIALSHLGSDIYSEPFDSITMIRKTRGIDVFLDGHSHSLITADLYPNAENKDVLLSSVGTKLQEVGELVLGKDGNIYALHYTEYEGQDQAVLKKIDEAYVSLDEILSEEICELDHDLHIADENGIRMSRSRETTCGDFFADAIRYEMGTDVAVINGGAVRSNIEAGTLTYQDLLNVAPFQNALASVRVSGQMILDGLEYGAKQTEYLYEFEGNAVGEFGAFLQVSGLKYTIDTSIESAVLQDDNNMFIGFKNANRRVKDVFIEKDGEYVPIDPDAMYTLGSTNYVLFNAGDGNTVFQDGEKIVENGPVDIQGLIDYAKYLNDFSGLYTETEGRITIE